MRTRLMNKKDKPEAQQQRRIRVGPAGWSYADWSGYVYPARHTKGFHEAAYLSEFFDTIEINTSFYQPLRPDHAALWVARVSANPAFLFTAKLWQKFTHDPSATTEDERAVRAGFDVLRQAEKLGAVLLQFPFSFDCTKETLALLRELHAGFCNIDQPIIGRSLEPSASSTSPIGYVRLHGRRYATWFGDNPATPA